MVAKARLANRHMPIEPHLWTKNEKVFGRTRVLWPVLHSVVRVFVYLKKKTHAFLASMSQPCLVAFKTHITINEWQITPRHPSDELEAAAAALG